MNINQAWQEYKSSLKAFLHSKINNQDDVEDILQDVLIKFYENMNTLNDHKSIKPWLFQIANHAIIDFYRQRGRQTKLNVSSLWYEPSDQDIKEELSHCIEPFLMLIDEQQAMLIQAIDINGESQKAHAQKLGISYSTLKSQVQSARSRLKMQFEACCEYQLDIQGNLMSYEEKPTNCKNC